MKVVYRLQHGGHSGRESRPLRRLVALSEGFSAP